MGDDTEFIKLPLMQRCTHKLWKARVHGYTEAIKLFQEEDEKSGVFQQYAPLISKFAGDSNAVAQEKGLEATLQFVQNASVASKCAKDIIGTVITKSIAAPKKSTQDLSLQILLMYIEIEKQDVVLEELIKGMEHKNPKIVAACTAAATTSLREFGVQVVSIKPFLKVIPTLLEDRDKTVREGAKAMIVEIYRWVGEAIKLQISTVVKPIHMADLETEFCKVKDQKASPSRFLKSQQEKQAKMAAASEEDGVDVADAEGVEEKEIDPLSLVSALNVLAKIPNDFYENIEAKKWQDRKEALEGLEKILDYPKFEKGDYGDLVRALTKVVSKDANVVVVGIAVKCIARLAQGLQKGFQPYAHSTLNQLLPKFKEKKANVVTPLKEAVDAMYPSINLEAVSEDIIGFLDQKNPSIKAETASYLARCFSKTSAAVLNKKLLKALCTALLKALNEPDPTVRDSAAEALGTAMKVVGEKNIMPFLPDLDALKLAKIKECCEKAVVKAPVMKVPAEKPSARLATPAKKILSGGAQKQQQQQQKIVKAPSLKELSDDAVDEKASELFPSDVLSNLSDPLWKVRMEAVELYQNIIMAMESGDNSTEVLVKTLVKKPGLKDNNFQVMKLKLDCLKYIAETFKLNPVLLDLLVGDVTEKLGDPKNGILAGETLMALSEATHFNLVGGKVLEYAFSQKSVKIQQESLNWISEAVQNFGFIINEKIVIEYLKKGLNSPNAAVKASAVTLSGIVYMYLKDQFLQNLDEKSSIMSLVTAEIEKLSGEEPAEPIRQCRLKNTFVLETTAAPGAAAAAAAVTPKKELPDDEKTDDKPKEVSKVDISPKITEQLLLELDSKNWKVRNDALTAVQAIIVEAKSIKSNIGELPSMLNLRFQDSNGKNVVKAIEVCQALAKAMGPACKIHVKSFLRGLFSAMGDNKQWVRAPALSCLNAWYAAAGPKEFFTGEMIPDALKTGSPALRVELYTWLSEILPVSKGVPKEDLYHCIPFLFAALEDRSADVRKAANASVLGLMMHVGWQSMMKEAEKLKPGSKNNVVSILEKTRGDLPAANVQEEERPKQDAKPKSAGVKTISRPSTVRMTKNRLSVVPKAAQKEEDIDTSPVLVVNKLKNQRMLDEQKLKILKWNFTMPRPEFVELLKDQVTAAGFNRNLMANMFHADFQHHLKAIEMLNEDLGNNVNALICNLDLILKWLTLRFFDTNPSVLLRGLDYLQNVFGLLIEQGYNAADVEANSFIPYLVLKVGDPKDAVRDKVHAILRQFSLMYTPSKIFGHVVEGIKSKNSRQRTECLDELGYLIEQFGIAVCFPNPVTALKEISKQIADRDNSVRSAALNAIVKAYNAEGDQIYKMIGKLPDKDMCYLEERIKRSAQSRAKSAPATHNVHIKKEEPEMDIREDIDETLKAPEAEPVDTALPEPVYHHHHHHHLHHQSYQKEDIDLPKLNLIPIDISFLNEPIPMPDYLAEKLKMIRPTIVPLHPIVEEIIRNMVSTNIDVAIEADKQLYGALTSHVADRLEPNANAILEAVAVQLKLANTLQVDTYPNVHMLYRANFRIIGHVFEQKSKMSKLAEQKTVKMLIRELLVALTEEKTKTFKDHVVFKRWIVKFISDVMQHSDFTNSICALIELLFDVVGSPPENSKITEKVGTCLLKLIAVIRDATVDVEELLSLCRVLYQCHLFLQAYPRQSWKSRPSEFPMRIINTLLLHLVEKKGKNIMLHLRLIDNAYSTELAIYLKKLVEMSTKSESKSKQKKLTNEMAEHLREVFQKIGYDDSRDEALIQYYEFKKQYPEVDLSIILEPTTQTFRDFLEDGLRRIEKERGPLKKEEVVSKSPSANTCTNLVPEINPPEDPELFSQYHLNWLKEYQRRNGLPVSTMTLPENDIEACD